MIEGLHPALCSESKTALFSVKMHIPEMMWLEMSWPTLMTPSLNSCALGPLGRIMLPPSLRNAHNASSFD